jgi:hypothetical protein
MACEVLPKFTGWIRIGIGRGGACPRLTQSSDARAPADVRRNSLVFQRFHPARSRNRARLFAVLLGLVAPQVLYLLLIAVVLLLTGLYSLRVLAAGLPFNSGFVQGMCGREGASLSRFLLMAAVNNRLDSAGQFPLFCS